MAGTATKADVYKRAATYIGKERPFGTTDDKEVVRVFNDIYDETLEYMLEQHPWSFAKKAVSLASKGTPDASTGWKYYYALPVDFVNIVSINNTDVWDRPRVPFEIMDQDIYLQDSTAALKYVFRQTIVSRFSGKFLKALSYALARDSFRTLSDGESASIELEQNAERALAEAKVFDSRKHLSPRPGRSSSPTDQARRQSWY